MGSKNSLIRVCDCTEIIKRCIADSDKYDAVYQSRGLYTHVQKRHPESLPYLSCVADIITHPDYYGIDPHESGKSVELVKVLSQNVYVGIKVDPSDKYLYVATIYTITSSKLENRVNSGRLTKI